MKAPKVKFSEKRGKCPRAERNGAANHYLRIYKVSGSLWEHCQYCDQAWRVNPSDRPDVINYVPPRDKRIKVPA
jgi:hypothetical protein